MILCFGLGVGFALALWCAGRASDAYLDGWKDGQLEGRQESSVTAAMDKPAALGTYRPSISTLEN